MSILRIIVLCAIFSSFDASASNHTQPYTITVFKSSGGVYYCKCVAEQYVYISEEFPGVYKIRVAGTGPKPTSVTLQAPTKSPVSFIVTESGGGWTGFTYGYTGPTFINGETYTLTLTKPVMITPPPRGPEQVAPPPACCGQYEGMSLMFDYATYP